MPVHVLLLKSVEEFQQAVGEDEASFFPSNLQQKDKSTTNWLSEGGYKQQFK